MAGAPGGGGDSSPGDDDDDDPEEQEGNWQTADEDEETPEFYDWEQIAQNPEDEQSPESPTGPGDEPPPMPPPDSDPPPEDGGVEAAEGAEAAAAGMGETLLRQALRAATVALRRRHHLQLTPLVEDQTVAEVVEAEVGMAVGEATIPRRASE